MASILTHKTHGMWPELEALAIVYKLRVTEHLYSHENSLMENVAHVRCCLPSMCSVMAKASNGPDTCSVSTRFSLVRYIALKSQPETKNTKCAP